VLRKRFRWILTGLVSAIILVLSLIPQLPHAMNPFSYSDKLEHFAAYFVLGLCLCISIEQGNSRRALIIAAACAFAYGALIEFLQFFTHRQPELLDLAANLLGALCGALAGSAILRRTFSRNMKS
jgi:VanZ family protein